MGSNDTTLIRHNTNNCRAVLLIWLCTILIIIQYYEGSRLEVSAFQPRLPSSSSISSSSSSPSSPSIVRTAPTTSSSNGTQQMLLSSTSVSTTTSASSKETESVAHEEYYQRAQAEHDSEIANGILLFGETSTSNPPQLPTTNNPQHKIAKYSDSQFYSLSTGIGNAGPDEFQLRGGHLIHGTKEPIFTREECEMLIKEARGKIANDLKQQSAKEDEDGGNLNGKRENAKLGEAKLSDLPLAREFLTNGVLNRRLVPLLTSRFGTTTTTTTTDDDTIDTNTEQVLQGNDDLVVYDALIIGHIGPSQSQPVHRDASFLTMNVALSPSSDYPTGGGTYFESLVQKHPTSSNTNDANTANAHQTGIVHLNQGHVLCHAGGIMHAGIGIEEGERWVMVLFVLSKKNVQIARRLHALGTRIASNYDTDTTTQSQQPTDDSTTPIQPSAEGAFTAALAHSPKDHLLITSLGSIYNSRGETLKSIQCLRNASSSYPPCHKAAMGLAQLLQSKNDIPGALEVYNGILDIIGESDLREGAWGALKAVGWNARMNASRCALMVAGRRLESGESGRVWVREMVPRVLGWLEIVVRPLQGENRAHFMGMVRAAEGMLEQANR